MYLRIISDLHLEFGDLELPDTSREDILIIAGDLGLARKSYTYLPFLEWYAEEFKYIIYVLGNHEFYTDSILKSVTRIKESTQDIDNLFILDNESIEIDGVKFIGSTLWTNFSDESAKSFAKDMMNDFRLIRNGPSMNDAYQYKFTPEYSVELFNKNIVFLSEELNTSKRKVVITHHAPSFKSVHPFYENSVLNTAFYSNLEYLVEKSDLWIHGHMHTSFDYKVGNSRVICNPRGYHNMQENPEFDPAFTIEI